MLRFYDNSPTWLAGVWSRGGWGCRAIPRGRRGWAAGHEQRPGGTPALGWSDLEFVFYTFHVVPNCCRAQIPKLHVWMSHFNLSENFDCYTKISTQKNMLIKLATERDVFFEFLKKLKIDEKLLFSYCLDKNNSFGYFGVMQKNIKKMLFSNFLFGDCSLK